VPGTLQPSLYGNETKKAPSGRKEPELNAELARR
jgi:hypothetical protein